MNAPDHRWHELLRRAGSALQGRAVGLWESDENGRLHPIASSSDRQLTSNALAELETALSRWHVDRPARGRWLASRLDAQRWCIAPVRTQPPLPPPSGIERRSGERIALELAGVCIGLIELMDGPGSADLAQGAELARSEARLRLLVDQVPALLWTTDTDLVITSSSGASMKTVGRTPSQVLGIGLADPRQAEVVGPEVVAAHRRALAGESVTYPMPCGKLAFDAHVEPMRDAAGRIIGVVGIAMDVSDRERALAEAREAQVYLAAFRSIVESASDAIIGKTLDGVIISWNPAAERMYGYTAAEAIGRPISMLVPPERPSELPSILERLRHGERVEPYETQRVRKDGSLVDVSMAISPILDSSGTPVGASAIARDITERRRAEEQLLHGAMHDPLTDLPNRTFFIERVALAMDRARRDPGYKFALLFLDLDNFKVINDSLGHEIGDRLLTRIASRLQSVVRPGDVVARLGGDEFTMLLEDVASSPEVTRATRRIEQSLAAPFMLSGRELAVTVSVGVALSTGSFERPEDLMRDADLAMYRAKALGRGRFEVFDPGMREKAHARFDMEADLNRAIERGELRLLFQPIVELRTGRVHAFEALIRWNHPERGVIMPLDFIPLAEETGLIVPVGAWVIREACWHARRWRNAFPDSQSMRVSVNVSPRQLDHPHFVEDVREALREEKVEPFRLRLEITESALMDDLDRSSDLLNQLRAIGVELHMDDFGTGFSSLSYLPRLPLQTIKIDRSFTHRMGLRRTDQELVRSIVDLARNLGMGVIAEGVENVLQAERLIAFGCELGQGFHFARPLEPISAGALLEPAPGGNGESPPPA